MKFKRHKKIRKFIRDKILLPIANKLIGADKQYVVPITYNGVRYEARYHRARYWWDDEPITIKGILDYRKIYHIEYWDGGTEGRVWCAIGFGWSSMFYAKNITEAEIRASEKLADAIDMWLKRVVNKNKEATDENA